MGELTVSSASTGVSVSVARDQFSSLPHFKAWVEMDFSVSVSDQLILTVAAEQVKLAHLASQDELFVFDRGVVGGNSAAETKYTAPKAKNLVAGSDPSQWSLTVLTHGSRLVEELKRMTGEIATVKRATNVAITQMKQHSHNLDKNLLNVKEYSKELNAGITPLLSVDLGRLRDNTRAVKLVAPAIFGKKQFLNDWLDLQQLQNIVVEFKSEFPACMNKFHATEQELAALSADTLSLVNSTDVWIGGTNSEVLCNEAVGVLKRLSELTGHNGEVGSESVKVINNCQVQILDLHKALFKAMFQTIQHSQKVLQSISQLQSRSTKLKPKLTQIGSELTKYEEKRVQAMKQVDVEFVYGCVLVEMLRRTVWSQSGADNSVKAEIGTRVAWKKQFQDTFPFVDILNEQEDLSLDTISTSTPSIVHNLVIPRNVVTDYISQVSSKEVRNNLESLLGGVSGSTAATSSFPKSLFRNGSISGSLMAERAPMSSVTNADDKIRGYEARIRKLEDLLHKQRMSQDTSRWSVSPGTPSGGFATGYIVSPVDSKEAVEEAESAADKEAREQAEQAEREAREAAEEEARLQREKDAAAFQAKIDKLSQSLLHTENEKNDLMANMASLESDFSRERRCLVQEISELKLRVEELEEQVETAAETSIERHQRADQETEELEQRLKAMTLVHNTVDDENSRLKITLQDLSQRLYTGYKRNCVLLESLGLQAQKEYDTDGSEVVSFDIHRVKGLRKKHRGKKGDKNDKDSESEPSDDFSALYWATKTTPDSFESNYRTFLARIFLDYDLYVEKVAKRFEDLEHLARKLQKEARNYRTMTQQLDDETRSKIALNRFKVGDLVLFLPTRDPSRQPQPWAAFNVGAPHFFLKQKPGRELKERDWLVGRITGMEERVVNGGIGDREENPFDLGQGLRWWWLEAEEE